MAVKVKISIAGEKLSIRIKRSSTNITEDTMGKDENTKSNIVFNKRCTLLNYYVKCI